MKQYYFKNNEFVIENFDKQKSFSSFLPGLAGKKGIPLWTFYVNRGQGIASFGVQDKNSPILLFNPAVTAYQSIGVNGFRTFVKINGKVHEFFKENNLNVKRVMRIKRSEFTIEEINYSLGLKMEVVYYGLPNENLAALVRQVTIVNLNSENIEIEIMDGISQLLPYKVGNSGFQTLGNLLRSWMEVYSLENNIGFYRMRSSTSDSAEVVAFRKGNFYISSSENKLIKPIVDASLVFDYDTTKSYARKFEKYSIKEISKMKQVTANKIPVGFSGITKNLKSNEEIRINTVIGHIHSKEYLLEISNKIVSTEYLNRKRLEANNEIENLLNEVTTKTAFPIFDDYIKQNYLDNLLRGGYPMILRGKEENSVYHLYSRRHGDLERDYNFFSLASEFYSQGNGSFRDVCQNRRNDILLSPKVEDFNIRMFGSFIQADGYNPHSINGSTFEIKDEKVIKDLTLKLFNNNENMYNLLKNKFTPGSIINTIANNNIECEYSDDELFDKIFPHALQNFEANFGEGYWIDHWTYILDLIENYQAIYPDKLNEILFDKNVYSYFYSPIYVLPRDEKTCLTKEKKIRRYGALLHFDKDKSIVDSHISNWLKDDKGKTIKTNLFGKLLTLVTTKIMNLDPYGIAIEMEADKPGWNDAMNGLPGLFGSGVSETIELKRVVEFLIHNFDESKEILILSELNDLMIDIVKTMKEQLCDFDYWDKINNYKEIYRKKIKLNSVGNIVINSKLIREALNLYLNKINIALEKAIELGNGIYPTYLIYEVTKFEELLLNGSAKIGNYGLPIVKALEFSMTPLPFYLEAPARALKVMTDTEKKRVMYNKIKQSNIYDNILHFYKTSEFLDNVSNEIGRGRSFTKGWQERESNFLHMTYKYLLGLLKAGMYQEFFEEIKTNLVCFMNPQVYGRSTLENSSFIAPSINPDPEIRGQGFVARLSGSTAEMLSIWGLMMHGEKPFIYNNKLELNLKPILNKEFFIDKKVSFTFLGKTKITYVNESNIDTFSPLFKISKYLVDGIEMKEVINETALNLRNGEIKEIIVFF
ncbi:MAG: cellobiose phosphorylase [Candidatus Izimaplasma sp.]|nr:cellobiose phosphorylase [Candidatus Izimaplasma bacterium]